MGLHMAVPSAQAQDVYHVTEDGDAGNSGSSFDSDPISLQGALDQADGDDVIVIAAGTYTPGDSRDDRFTVTGAQDGLKIYGGWDGATSFSSIAEVEDNLAGRNLGDNPAVLSGDIDDDDITTGGITEDASDIRGGNSYTVVYLNGTTGGSVTTDTILDGVVITGGQANGSSNNYDPNDPLPPSIAGGGMYCDSRCSPQIRNTTFTGNTAGRFGGALLNNGHSYESSPQITGSTFTGNSADANGGAIYNDGRFGGTSSPQIRNTVFTRNSAVSYGGAICNDGRYTGVSNPQIVNTVFTNNSSSYGGALCGVMLNGESSPQITGSAFTSNSADTNGGAIHNRADKTSSMRITNTTFADNSADELGGAILTSMTGMDVTADLYVTNVVFTGNSAGNDGGAISNIAYGLGDSSSSIQITNSTFVSNFAGRNGAALYNTKIFGISVNSVLTNSIFWSNSANNEGDEVYNNGGTTSTISHTLIRSGCENVSNASWHQPRRQHRPALCGCG